MVEHDKSWSWKQERCFAFCLHCNPRLLQTEGNNAKINSSALMEASYALYSLQTNSKMCSIIPFNVFINISHDSKTISFHVPFI